MASIYSTPIDAAIAVDGLFVGNGSTKALVSTQGINSVGVLPLNDLTGAIGANVDLSASFPAMPEQKILLGTDDNGNCALSVPFNPGTGNVCSIIIVDNTGAVIQNIDLPVTDFPAGGNTPWVAYVGTTHKVAGSWFASGILSDGVHDVFIAFTVSFAGAVISHEVIANYTQNYFSEAAGSYTQLMGADTSGLVYFFSDTQADGSFILTQYNSQTGAQASFNAITGTGFQARRLMCDQSGNVLIIDDGGNVVKLLSSDLTTVSATFINANVIHPGEYHVVFILSNGHGATSPTDKFLLAYCGGENIVSKINAATMTQDEIFNIPLNSDAISSWDATSGIFASFSATSGTLDGYNVADAPPVIVPVPVVSNSFANRIPCNPCPCPVEGRLAYSFSLNFSTTKAASFNVGLVNPLHPPSEIAGIFFFWSGDQDITVRLDVTNQTFVIKAGTQGYIPIIATNPVTLNFSVPAVTTILGQFILTNYAMAPFVQTI